MFLGRLWRQVSEFRQMPRVSVDLMLAATANNDRFYHNLVQQHFVEARKRHPRLLLVPQMVYGVALCPLPPKFDDYYMRIEASARRNHKKACREGCSVRRIQFNEHLDEIREIRRSADVRQGRLMPEEYRSGVVMPCTDPPSRTNLHDFPFFGVFFGEKLIGYAGCLVAGEICIIQHILGHADHLTVGVVPLLIIGIAQHLYEQFPSVRYYAYGTYFGAGETMRRFKRKFGFQPHRVDWMLDGATGSDESASNSLDRSAFHAEAAPTIH
jgi:hypothetical protein